MHINDIVFSLNAEEKIAIELDMPLEKLPCYCLVPIVLFYNKQRYILSTNGLPDDMINLRNFLTKGLKNELPLHPSITKDIGYLSNINIEYNQRDFGDDDQWVPNPDLTYNNYENYFSWVGTYYGLWGHDNLKTWIYNDPKGNIIFEITPQYPDLFTEDKKTVQVSYEDWMELYKPFLTRIISPEIATQWIEQANKVITRIEEKWAKESTQATNENQIKRY